MLDFLSENVNRQISFHLKIPDFNRPNYYHKNFLAVTPKNMDSVTAFVLKSVWSDIVWKEGRRSEDHFLHSDFCVLDIDSGLRLEDARRQLQDTMHIIATTKSHRAECHRFRIIVPWVHRIDSLDLYRFNLEQRIRDFDADPAGIDGARFFWPSKNIYSLVKEGYGEEVVPLPKNFKPLNHRQILTMKKYQHMTSNGNFPSWIRDSLKEGVPDGERNNYIYQIAKTLTYCGYDEKKILELIIHSKVPLKTAPKKEIESAVASGVKKAKKIILSGRED